MVRPDVMGFSAAGKSTCISLMFSVKAIPTAPDEYTFSFENRVKGLPVTKGVEVAIMPNFLYSPHYANESDIRATYFIRISQNLQ
jgi:hypothetical protein